MDSCVENNGMAKRMNAHTLNTEKNTGVSWGGRLLEVCFLAVLLLFPLRHAFWGLDLWDTGYNYANYTFAGPEHMGITWWFSTYLSNVLGHMLTLLPGGHTLAGMNIYTGLLVGGLAVMGYLFCSKRLGIPRELTFAGELIALCLCWCPTAKLYDYLTYLFFMMCVILLYEALTRHRKLFLFLAGVCLGGNIFIRFSNLPEAGLILGVWAYAFLEDLTEKKQKAEPGQEKSLLKISPLRTASFWKNVAGYTFWCLLGWAAALLAGFVWIAIRYGLGQYVEGIRLLFAMTETATDYKATSMIYGLIWPFWNGKYWIARIMVFVIAALLLVFCMDYAPLCVKEKRGQQAGKRAEKFCTWTGLLGTVFLVSLLLYWLFTRKEPSFTSTLYRSYDPIYWPAVMLLVMIMGSAVADLLRKNCSLQKKLIAGMLLLVMVLTSLGSNNGIYPSFNNLFIAAPWFLERLAEFTKWTLQEGRKKPAAFHDFRLKLYPAALALWGILGLSAVQFAQFGTQFAFCEGTGIQGELKYQVENCPALSGIYMNEERAQWMNGLCEFASQEGFAGQEVILYGNIPALSFYLGMPAAFNTWSDLDSYHLTTMENAVKTLKGEIRDKGREMPVVIAEKQYGASESTGEVSGKDAKWQLIHDFMTELDYERTYENDRFVVWQGRK